MRHLCLLSLASMLIVGCGESTNSVTAPTSSSSAAIQPNDPAPPPDVDTSPNEPGWTIVGPTRTCLTSKDEARWVLDVKDAGPGFHIIAVAYWDERAGCEHTVRHAGEFTVEGPRDYAKHGSGKTVFSYNAARVHCGRVQVDAGIIDPNGKETLIIGKVITAEADCPPPPPPPPTCEEQNPSHFTAQWLTIDPEGPISSTASVSGEGTWKLTLYAGSQPGQADYTKDTAAVTLPCGESKKLGVKYFWQHHRSKYWWFVLERNGVMVFTSSVVSHQS